MYYFIVILGFFNHLNNTEKSSAMLNGIIPDDIHENIFQNGFLLTSKDVINADFSFWPAEINVNFMKEFCLTNDVFQQLSTKIISNKKQKCYECKRIAKNAVVHCVRCLRLRHSKCSKICTPCNRQTVENEKKGKS